MNTEYNTNLDKFVNFMNTKAGATIYKACLVKTQELVAAGWRRYGINAIVEAVRFDHSIEVGPKGEKFKINNNYAPLLARTLLAYNDDIPEGFFQLKKTKGVA